MRVFFEGLKNKNKTFTEANILQRMQNYILVFRKFETINFFSHAISHNIIPMDMEHDEQKKIQLKNKELENLPARQNQEILA